MLGVALAAFAGWLAGTAAEPIVLRAPSAHGEMNATLVFQPARRRFAPPILVVADPALGPEIFSAGPGRGLVDIFSERGFLVYASSLPSHESDPWLDAASRDLAALVSFTNQQGKSLPIVIAFGFSGTAAYAWLAKSETSRVRALATIGSPWNMELPSDILRSLAQEHGDTRNSVSIATWDGVVPPTAFAPPAKPLPPVRRSTSQPTPTRTYLELLLSGDGIAPTEARRIMSVFGRPIPANAINEWARWVRDTTPPRAGRIRVGAPTLLIAGSTDVIAPPFNVERTRFELDATSIRYVRVGRNNLNRSDYSHLALVAGTQVTEDVFTAIAEWVQDEVVR